MNPSSRTRCALVCAVFIALFSIFSFRLIYLQAIKHDEYAGLAAEKHVHKQIIHGERGLIFDANNEVLAHNIPVETVWADATHLNNVQATVEILNAELEIPSDEVAEKLNSGRRYIVIKREVPAARANTLREKLRAGNFRGIYFDQDATRLYPNGSMLCHVIGFTDFDHHGVQGVEASMEEYLHGQDGYRFVEHNRAGQEIVPYRGQERASRDGYQVHLTVDLGLQSIVEEEIDAAMKEYSPQKATIILMRPQTGEILAMANRPNFDLNLCSEAKPEQMKNRAIIDMMEPGSTFKIVAAAAALNEHKMRPDSEVFCENGLWNFGGSALHDHRAFGYLSVRDILVKSSNIGAAKLALSIGDQKFYEYIRRFGFGERTGIELPGEINGVIRPPQTWSKISITRIPMGHDGRRHAVRVDDLSHRYASNGNLAPCLRRPNYSIDLARQFNSRALAKPEAANVFVEFLIADAQSQFGRADIAGFDENVAHAQITKRAVIVQSGSTEIPKAVLAKNFGIRSHLMLVQGGGGGDNLESRTRFHHVDDGPVFHLFRLCL